jgi:hypothetical protein
MFQQVDARGSTTNNTYMFISYINTDSARNQPLALQVHVHSITTSTPTPAAAAKPCPTFLQQSSGPLSLHAIMTWHNDGHGDLLINLEIS